MGKQQNDECLARGGKACLGYHGREILALNRCLHGVDLIACFVGFLKSVSMLVKCVLSDSFALLCVFAYIVRLI